MSRSIVAWPVAAVMLLASCHDSAAVAPVSPADLAGRYVLESVSGEPVPTGAPGTTLPVLSGEVILSADGAALRRVHYALTNSTELVDLAAGTFAIRGSSVVLSLTTTVSEPPVRVRWTARRAEDTLTIRFGNPLDGPDVVEVYRRE